MRFVPTLSVEWSAGGLRFRLEVPEQDLAEPLLEEVRHPLDEDTLRALEQSADALLRGAESAGFPDEARARGAVLYRTLVPSRLRPRLRAVRGPLLVSTSLYGMPWELLHDDEEFWGLRYGLGKRLVMDRPLPAAASARLRPRPRALVIGSDPRGDLRFVGQEVEAICEALEPIADIECVSGRLATFDAVTAYLGQSFDLIHYCGHLVASAGAKPALLLAEEQTLSAGAIEANVTGRPLVFLNACASARGEERPGESAWEATASSVVYGFLFGGAVAVVGTLCEVADRHAAALAAAFYRGALERVPIGEALRAARGECRAHPESASSPTWLSAVLYGNPAQVLLPGPAEEREPVRSVVPAAAPVPRRAAWPALRWTALLVLVLAVVAGVLHLRSLRPPQPLVVGVMEVRSRGPNVPPWMRELTRDGLNTILREFGQLRVYARQKIDFVREKRGLTEIEAAETLGMSKMLSATIDTDGAVVTLDLEVVDVSSGLL
ncbi:MAG TPA: CHAT domain-containing protein, partial [Candidatus Elarobacter sp.]|nr:CHAT domain-containing protein [Candidatus Elarobacter sp.]